MEPLNENKTSHEVITEDVIYYMEIVTIEYTEATISLKLVPVLNQ